MNQPSGISSPAGRGTCQQSCQLNICMLTSSRDANQHADQQQRCLELALRHQFTCCLTRLLVYAYLAKAVAMN
jgi:hypothetical protein